MTYRQISDTATTTWQALPEPNPRKLGYYLASGQVQFSTYVGYTGGKHFQERINRVNQVNTNRGN